MRRGSMRERSVTYVGRRVVLASYKQASEQFVSLGEPRSTLNNERRYEETRPNGDETGTPDRTIVVTECILGPLYSK